ncbi:MAG TPA: hypothetical protein VFS40_09225 [Gemmatimonadales bacterium]|nr:hypothetical protein [Gemmatimonadales bacterium]
MPVSDLLAQESFLLRARADRIRGADEAARIVLGAYAVARLIDRVLSGTAVDEEAIVWERASAQRYLAGLPTAHPEVAHLAGLVEALEELAALRRSLRAYAYYLEREARLDEAHDVLTLTARTWPGEIPPRECGELALAFARVDRLRARWQSASDSCHVAEEAGLACGDMVITLRARLARGAVLRGQGNLPEARAIAEQGARDAEAAGLPDIRAGAFADLGAALTIMGRRVESLAAFYEAFRGMTDPVYRMRVLGDLGIGLAEIGAREAARIALRIVADAPETEELIRVNARLELMDLESAAGNRLAFEQLRQSVRGFEPQMPPSMAVDYRFKAGTGLARFGQAARARALWTEALALAEAHDLNAWYFRLEKVLAEAGTEVVAAPPAAAATSDAAGPEIERMTVGLREYAELAAAGR